MTLLTIDTSGLEGSLAVGRFQGDDLQESCESRWQKKAVHSEIITAQLQDLLNKSRIQFQDLTHIAVNVGPGSFTGIRVGINLARSLSYSLDIPVASLNTLELLAYEKAKTSANVFIAIKAIQQFYYAAAYGFENNLLMEKLQPQSMDTDQVQSLTHQYSTYFVESQSAGFIPQTNAQTLLQQYKHWSKVRHFSGWQEVKPLYIRRSEAEEKLDKRSLLKPT